MKDFLFAQGAVRTPLEVLSAASADV